MDGRGAGAGGSDSDLGVSPRTIVELFRAIGALALQWTYQVSDLPTRLSASPPALATATAVASLGSRLISWRVGGCWIGGFQVSFCIMEVYNETVRDLLDGGSKDKPGLEIRQTPNEVAAV